VIPLLLTIVGAVLLGAGVAVLRSFGPRYRVGRLLAVTPQVSVSEARAMAARGERRIVRVDGRIDAEDEFEDADHRPLVFRRTRLQARQGRAWTTFEDGRETVPFEVREGLDAVAIDRDALGDGLVVVPRESVGVAADLGDRTPDGMAPDTVVRALIEQISSVEHAIVIGTPVRDPDGTVRMTAGLGRPLVLTTLEVAEAMRILTDGRAALARLAGFLLVAGLAVLVLAGLAWLADAAGVLAASPTPQPGGDPRSPGEGPGLVGDPLFALVMVVLIAVAAVAATSAWVRLTRPRK
jgi:hypothetical protein